MAKARKANFSTTKAPTKKPAAKKAGTTKASAKKSLAKKSPAIKPASTKAASKLPAKKPAKASTKKAPLKSTAKSATQSSPKEFNPQTAFLQGVELSGRGFVFDAMAAFKDVVKTAPKHEIADDALVNVGLCSLRLGLFNDAVEAFTTVLAQYPNALIAEIDEGQEHGRTAAKALYGRVRARAGLGDFAGARTDADALASHEDSYVIEAGTDQRITFHALAQRFLAGT